MRYNWVMTNLSDHTILFALHLIEREAEVRPRKNKRSASEDEKFLLSTEWLCNKLQVAHASHKGASVCISRDKNRYKAGRYVPRGGYRYPCQEHNPTEKSVIPLCYCVLWLCQQAHFVRQFVRQ